LKAIPVILDKFLLIWMLAQVAYSPLGLSFARRRGRNDVIIRSFPSPPFWPLTHSLKFFKNEVSLHPFNKDFVNGESGISIHIGLVPNVVTGASFVDDPDHDPNS
jgi:hypothetical protein